MSGSYSPNSVSTPRSEQWLKGSPGDSSPLRVIHSPVPVSTTGLSRTKGTLQITAKYGSSNVTAGPMCGTQAQRHTSTTDNTGRHSPLPPLFGCGCQRTGATVTPAAETPSRPGHRSRYRRSGPPPVGPGSVRAARVVPSLGVRSCSGVRWVRSSRVVGVCWRWWVSRRWRPFYGCQALQWVGVAALSVR